MMQIEVYDDLMRITVDIDDATMKEVLLLTGEKNKSPALAKAVTEFVHRKRAREFGRLMREGAFDYPAAASGEDATNPVPPLVTG